MRNNVWAKSIIALSLVYGCSTGPKSAVLRSPVGAMLYCYDCDDQSWSVVGSAADSALVQFAEALGNARLDLMDKPSGSEQQARWRISRFDYVLAPDLDHMPSGSTGSAVQSGGVFGVPKAFRAEIQNNSDSSGSSVYVHCLRYLFPHKEDRELHVSVEVIGHPPLLQNSTSVRELLTDAALICLAGSLDAAVPNASESSLRASELSMFVQTSLAAVSAGKIQLQLD